MQLVGGSTIWTCPAGAHEIRRFGRRVRVVLRAVLESPVPECGFDDNISNDVYQLDDALYETIVCLKQSHGAQQQFTLLKRPLSSATEASLLKRFFQVQVLNNKRSYLCNGYVLKTTDRVQVLNSFFQGTGSTS